MENERMTGKIKVSEQFLFYFLKKAIYFILRGK